MKHSLLTDVGYLVHQAAKVGTPIPYMTRIYALLQKMNGEFVTEQATRKVTWPQPALMDELSANNFSLATSVA